MSDRSASMTPFKVLVCGGRDFLDRAQVTRVFKRIFEHYRDVIIIHGKARGADKLGGIVGRELGAYAVWEFPALWERFGNVAGPIRNRWMYHAGDPDVTIHFPGGAGTRNMVDYAKSQGGWVMSAEEAETYEW